MFRLSSLEQNDFMLSGTICLNQIQFVNLERDPHCGSRF